MNKTETKWQNVLQFVYFCMVGASGTLISLGILYLFTEILNLKYIIGLIIGYYIGISNNFIWNHFFVFEKTDQSFLIEYLKYLLTMLIGSFAYFLSTMFFTNILNVWYLLSAIISIIFSTTINFVLSKLWVFERYYLNVGKEYNGIKKEINIGLIISCLNEEKNLPVFLNELIENISETSNIRIYLIDNGSIDKTGDIIDDYSNRYEFVTSIKNKSTLGYGESIRKGISAALADDISYDYIGWSWSDNQIAGRDVYKVIKILKYNQSLFVKAVRYAKDYSFWRKIQSFWFNLLFAILFNSKIQDVNGCPKFIKSDLFEYLELTSRNWFLDAEVVAKLNKILNKEDILHVPVKFNKRMHGKSKTKWFTAIELFFDLVYFRLFGMNAWLKKRIPEECKSKMVIKIG